jgi:hypothetical protein
MKYKSEESYIRNTFALKESFELDDPNHIITDNKIRPIKHMLIAFQIENNSFVYQIFPKMCMVWS